MKDYIKEAIDNANKSQDFTWSIDVDNSNKHGFTMKGVHYISKIIKSDIWTNIKHWIYNVQYDTKVLGEPEQIATGFSYPMKIYKVRIRLFGITIKSISDEAIVTFTNKVFKKNDIIETA